MKKYQNIILIVSIISLPIIGYVAGLRTEKPKSENEILLEFQVTELAKENKTQSERWNKTVDSLSNYYAGIDKANERTNKSINKILKQNEKNKGTLVFITDSTRLYIIDSLLRSAGVRY